MKQELNQAYLKHIRFIYKKATKSEKKVILDQAEYVTGLSRKRIIRIMSSKTTPSVRPPGRPKLYTYDIEEHLLKLYTMMERICPKRMKEAIPIWIDSYEAHFGGLDELTREKLLDVSASTIGRILKRNEARLKGKSSTRVNHKIKQAIPIKRLDEEVTKPGTVQADTVAHCGNSLAGEFINTVTVTDIFTGWTENRASWTKHSDHIRPALEKIENAFPFEFRNFDTDCGSEFLNYKIMSYFERNKSRKYRVKMRRSRPYKKNDQCYVEQKNYTHVRNLFAYDRLDDFYLVALMNEIYEDYWNPFNNYFLPSFKLERKVRVGGRIKKYYDQPKTPAQRILDHQKTPSETKRKIRSDLVRLDPIELKQGLEEKLTEFYTALKRIKMTRRTQVAS